MALTNPQDEDALPTALTSEDIIRAQAADPECQAIKKALEDGAPSANSYSHNEQGMLIRKAPDWINQIYVPTALRGKILHMAHHTATAGHPGGTRMYLTLRQSFYWPSMALDAHNTVRSCVSCAKNRINLKKHKSFLKLFPASRPLQYVSIDILGPMPRTSRGFRYILVITDRYSKLVQTVPLTKITALSVAQAFCERWVFQYGPPEYLLSDRGTQFVSKFMQKVCKILGIRQAFTAAYHPQTNGQAERFNRTLLAALRTFCGEHPKQWGQFLQAIVYGYNSTYHRAIKMSPLQLILTIPPPLMALQKAQSLDLEGLNRREARSLFTKRLATLMATATQQLAMAKAAYKANFDARVKPVQYELTKDDFVFVRRERRTDDDLPIGHGEKKLLSKVTGPYPVVSADTDKRTIVVRMANGEEQTISLDRIMPVPRAAVIRATSSETNPTAAAPLGAEDATAVAEEEDSRELPATEEETPNVTESSHEQPVQQEDSLDGETREPPEHPALQPTAPPVKRATRQKIRRRKPFYSRRNPKKSAPKS